MATVSCGKEVTDIITGLADTIMVNWLGSLELAARQVVISISTVSFTIYLGLGSATAIRTSYFKGAGD